MSLSEILSMARYFVENSNRVEIDKAALICAIDRNIQKLQQSSEVSLQYVTTIDVSSAIPAFTQFQMCVFLE